MKLKILSVIVVAIIAIIMILSFTKNMIIKVSAERMVESVTGLKLSISKLDVSLLKTSIEIKGLKLFNPRNFPDKVMLDMPYIYINYDLGDLLKRNMHFYNMKIELKQLTVVKNKDGQLNLNSLKTVEDKGQPKKVSSSDTKSFAMQIDKLDLKIGTAVYKDYTKPPHPLIREFNVNIDESYSNVTDMRVLASLIMVKSLQKTAIAELANFNINLLKNTVSGAFGPAGKVATSTMDKTEKVLEGAVSGIKEVFGGFSAGSESKK